MSGMLVGLEVLANMFQPQLLVAQEVGHQPDLEEPEVMVVQDMLLQHNQVVVVEVDQMVVVLGLVDLLQ
jgi:hypothetical protein